MNELYRPFAIHVVLALAIFALPLAALAQIDREVSVPIQVITTQEINNLPVCGRAFLDLAKIPIAPLLDVSKGQVRVPASLNNSMLLDNLQIRDAGGSVQPASAPICFDNIEVLKAPLDVLYGDSTAGTIKVITRKPNPGAYGSSDLLPVELLCRAAANSGGRCK